CGKAPGPGVVSGSSARQWQRSTDRCTDSEGAGQAVPVPPPSHADPNRIELLLESGRIVAHAEFIVMISMCRVELCLRDGVHPVLIEVLRHPRAHPLETGDLAVLAGLSRKDLRSLERCERPRLMRSQCAVSFLELAVRQP